jgi:multiple sugar transport system substrate-binding protein
MKKTTAVVVVLVLAAVVSFVGCKGEPSGPVTVNMAITTGPNANAARAIVPFFEKDNPNTKVNIIEIPWNEIDTRQLLDFTSRKGGYDLVMQSTSFFGSYAASGYLEPLDAYLSNKSLIDAKAFNLDDFNKTVLDLVGTYKGKLYAMPYMYFPQIMVYRKDLLAKIGASVPKTFDEFLAVVKKLDTLPKMHGTSVIGIKGGAGADVYAWAPYLFNFGGSFTDAAGNPTFNTPQAVQALEFYKGLLAYSPSEAMSNGTDQVTSAFGAGNLGIMFMDADNAGALLDPTYTKLTRDQLGFAPMPSGPAGGQGRALLGAWSMGISKFSKSKAAAFKVMTFLLSNRPDVTAEFVKQGINPRLSVLQQYASQYPNYGVVAEELPFVGPIPAVKNWIKMEDALATAISNALLNVKTPKEALDEAQAVAVAAAKQ